MSNFYSYHVFRHLGFSTRHVLAKTALFSFLIAIFPAQRLSAHGDIHVQIERINPKIQKSPSAELYVKRGDLYRLDENYTAALADFNRAEKLNPKLETIYLGRGRTLFEAGRYQEALPALNQLMEMKPDHPDGRILRARVSFSLGDSASALRDYDHVVATVPSPSPDCFLERSATLIKLSRPQDAIRSLDEGISRLGNLPALQLAALEIEIDLKQYDSALVRIDQAMVPLQRREQWLTRRGEVLQTAGRSEEAKAAYTVALSAIQTLPPIPRSAKPTRELESRLQSLLEAHAPENTKTKP